MSLDHMKEQLLKLLDHNSLTEIIAGHHFEATVKFPIVPSRPTLNRVHTAAQALEYATVLANHETDKEHYHTQLKVHRESQGIRRKLFKWACLQDIGAFDNVPIKKAKAIEIAWNMAWERGHSEGLYRVYEELLELNEILECI